MRGHPVFVVVRLTAALAGIEARLKRNRRARTFANDNKKPPVAAAQMSRDIHRVLGDLLAAGDVTIASRELVRRLVALPSGRWAAMAYRRGGPLTEHRLARLLSPFKVYPGLISSGYGRCRGYRLTAFTRLSREVFGTTPP
jgi:hypothetical protein